MNDYVALILGVVCAAIGGETFIRGTVGIAYWARVSPAIIGVTVAAFATSSPELAVSIRASTAGIPQISLGDVLGSNVANVALVLALALCISGIHTPRQSIKRDFPVALLIPITIALLSADGLISRLDGFLLLVGFLTWLAAVIMDAHKQRKSTEEVQGGQRIGLAIALSLVGLAFLIGAGHLVVIGAKGIARSYGIGEFVIGATVVAIGTSMPELAMTILAKVRGHDEMGLGTILGSNIFNGLLIVAVASIICPITIVWREIAVALVFGVLVVACTYPLGNGFIGRRRGFLLLALYVIYLAIILQKQPT
jgi:cation:H+ antiporter